LHGAAQHQREVDARQERAGRTGLFFSFGEERKVSSASVLTALAPLRCAVANDIQQRVISDGAHEFVLIGGSLGHPPWLRTREEALLGPQEPCS